MKKQTVNVSKKRNRTATEHKKYATFLMCVIAILVVCSYFYQAAHDNERAPRQRRVNEYHYVSKCVDAKKPAKDLKDVALVYASDAGGGSAEHSKTCDMIVVLRIDDDKHRVTLANTDLSGKTDGLKFIEITEDELTDIVNRMYYVQPDMYRITDSGTSHVKGGFKKAEKLSGAQAVRYIENSPEPGRAWKKVISSITERLKGANLEEISKDIETAAHGAAGIITENASGQAAPDCSKKTRITERELAQLTARMRVYDIRVNLRGER